MASVTANVEANITNQNQEVIVQVASSMSGFLGFTYLQVGFCQPKNSSSIIIANFFSACIAILGSWAFGFALCFGSASNSFTSYSMFFLINADVKTFTTWASYSSFAVIFTVVYNGGFVERLKFPVYASTSLILTGIVFPIGCHWCWHQNGWLYKVSKIADKNRQFFGFDAGGLGPLHISAGSIALVGGLFLKARAERCNTPRFHLVPGKTNLNVFLGGTLAMFSLLSIDGTATYKKKSYANSLIACLTSSLVAIMFKRSRVAGEVSNVRTLINGALTGMVATSSEAPNGFHPYASFGIGMASGIVYIACSCALKHFRFDDVVDSVAVHLGGGICGQIVTCLCDKSIGVLYAGTQESFKWLGWSLLGIIAYAAWAGTVTALLMLPLHLSGRLKYTDENIYERGIDACIHKEPAYPDVKLL